MQPAIYNVAENRLVALETYLMKLSGGAPVPFVPGQFVHLEVPNRPDLLLRRPFSVHEYDAQTGEISVIYQIVGEGSKAFSALSIGDSVSVLGPIGNGFPEIPGAKRIILTGGGIGCAPLLSAALAWPDIQFDAALGYRSKAHVYQQDAFEKACQKVLFVTDDGSFGQKGFVTDALTALLKEPCDAVFACGPKPMFRALQDLMNQYDVPCYASLEERMGCGMGACVTCTCTVVQKGVTKRPRVCKDGPVFDLSEVIL